ncbi:RNA methyltransferase [Oculatella sp. FACHB-28]|uniref:RNA methyltransferase n=1 Tax=Oculatella sp. FACHB-28 TaxID=2692845 RepID=UPI0016890430|nr:RNA methyltransferase [Oculatella sp. FACHB-28]
MANRAVGNRTVGRDSYANLSRHSLIVCATLVQNPANLGGLCRTAEAFRLESLVLADGAIIQTPAFKNLSASTHHWQPFTICPVESLLTLLTQQQQSGYNLIALHTSPEAIPLTQFTFPRQSVLILGQELTGIPSNVLELCDQMVMIPQFGLVESLNVQTAGAIAIYEYVKQHSDET